MKNLSKGQANEVFGGNEKAKPAIGCWERRLDPSDRKLDLGSGPRRRETLAEFCVPCAEKGTGSGYRGQRTGLEFDFCAPQAVSCAMGPGLQCLSASREQDGDLDFA